VIVAMKERGHAGVDGDAGGLGDYHWAAGTGCQ
jgi:hypothetical protein